MTENITERISQALHGAADLSAVFTSKQEILIKAAPLADQTSIEPVIKARLAQFGNRIEILSTCPSLVIRVRPFEISAGSKFPWFNLALFGLTVITTLLTGALWDGVDWISDPSMFLVDPWRLFYAGLPFSISLLAILLFHEFGHYFAARYHGVNVSLPYFIPAPPGITLIGTFGALIKSRSPFINKKQLMDVGSAGPLAGLIIAIIVLIIGIKLSTVQPMPAEFAGILFGESLLFNLITYLVKGPIADSQVLMINSIGFAGWVGLLVTMFNLLPLGQLDGGHIAYALFGKSQRNIANLMLIGLAVMSFYWPGWIVWLFIAIILRPSHPPTVMDEVPLGPGRKLIGILSVLAFIICFIPAPLAMVGNP